MPNENVKNDVASAADQITSAVMKEMGALLSIYSEEEKAAFFEGLLVGVFQIGRMKGLSEAASLQVAK